MNTLTLNDITSGYAAIIVFCGDSMIISWNHSLTLVAWAEVEPGQYTQFSIKTLSKLPANVLEVCEAADRWYYSSTFVAGNPPSRREILSRR